MMPLFDGPDTLHELFLCCFFSQKRKKNKKFKVGNTSDSFQTKHIFDIYN